MATSSLTMAFVMDPIESIDIEADTTFRADAGSAASVATRVLYVDPGRSRSLRGRTVLWAKARSVDAAPGGGEHVDLGPERSSIVLDDEVRRGIPARGPPVDAAYVVATQILTLCHSRALVLNRPESESCSANEKLYALHFRELMAETRVTRRIPELVGLPRRSWAER